MLVICFLKTFIIIMLTSRHLLFGDILREYVELTDLSESGLGTPVLLKL